MGGSSSSKSKSSSKSSSSKSSGHGYVSRHDYVPKIVSRHDYVPKIDPSDIVSVEVDVPFEWGDHGPLWKINDKNEKEIMHLEKYGFNSVYSVDTFHSNTFTEVSFKLKIKKRNEWLYIGIINNVQHKNTRFWGKEIPNNDETKIKQNVLLYWCICWTKSKSCDKS